MSYDQVPEVKETEVQIETQLVTGGTPQGKETRSQRDEMKALSLEIFGKTSRYSKMFVYDDVLATEVDETIPGSNGEPDTTKKVRVPILFNGSKQSRRKYRNVEEVIGLLYAFKAKRDGFLAQMKAQQAQDAAAKEAELAATKLQQELGGSALT